MVDQLIHLAYNCSYSSKLSLTPEKENSMNIRVKAASIVAVYAVVSVVTILAIQLAFTYIPIQVMGMFGALVILGFMLSLAYAIVLAKLATLVSTPDTWVVALTVAAIVSRPH